MVRLASKQMLLMGGALAIVSAALAWDAAAQPQPGAGQPIPDFSSDLTQWIGGIGVDFLPVEGSPMPNRQDPAHPFNANNSGRQPNYRIADLSNPNLKQWAKDIMKKDNDEVLAGKIAFTPRQSCLPAGVPGFILYGGGNVYFVQ